MAAEIGPAGLPRRLAAICYDALLLFAVAWAVGATAIGLRVALQGEALVRHTAGAAVAGPLFQLALLLAWVLFFCWFWTHSGQTLGMQAWRLRLQRADGGKPDWPAALLRFGGAVVSFACLGAGYWWMLIDPEQRTWHDRWSGTRVVLLGKN